MSRFHVVVTDQVFPDVEVEAQLLAGIDAELTVASGGRADVLEAAANADALLNTYLALDAEAVARLQRCRIIARYGIGVDNVDLDAARAAGIAVTNVPDYCVEEVATHTLMLLLGSLRKVPAAHAAVLAGSWGLDTVRPLHRLSQLTVGLIGYGRIGSLVGRWLRTLGAGVLVADPYLHHAPDEVELVELDELLARADAVSLHCPLTDATRGLIDAERLSRMRPGAVLVNTSRGPLVDLPAVLAALRGGALGGAALDVFPDEPPDAATLRDVPGLLVTPHVAFYSEEAIRESQRKAATQVAKVLTGQPPDYAVVSPPDGAPWTS